MKTISIIIAAGLITFSFINPAPIQSIKMSSEIHKKSLTHSTKGKKLEVEVAIEIGKKKSGCSGLGICNITVSNGIKGGDGAPVRAIPYVADGKIVALEFIKIEGEKSREIYQNLEKGFFLMEENFKGKIDFSEFYDEVEIHFIEVNAGKLNAVKSKAGWMVELS